MGNTSGKENVTLTADLVLKKLLESNYSYAAGRSKNHKDVAKNRVKLANHGQKPVAAIIACADSRVSPEIIFRATLGDLFVIRAAGNTPWGPEVIGSLEYAVDHLNVPLVLILGHTKCGAVAAACAGGDPLPGQLGEHITAIATNIEAAGGIPDDMDIAVRRNVKAGVGMLRKDTESFMAKAVERGVLLRGAIYNINTGKVALLKESSASAENFEETDGEDLNEVGDSDVEVVNKK